MGSLRQTALFLLISILALCSIVAVYISTFTGSFKLFQHDKKSGLALTNECAPESVSQVKENPNKSLFMSCGGFLQ